jgi:hypothetical protein
MIKIYKIIILPVVLYGCGTWSLTLREEHRLRVFVNRALRGIFGPKRKWQEAGEDCIMGSFITCALRHILLGSSSQGECDVQVMSRGWER